MPDNERFVTYPLRLVNLSHSIREAALTAICEHEDGTAGFISIPLSEVPFILLMKITEVWSLNGDYFWTRT